MRRSLCRLVARPGCPGSKQPTPCRQSTRSFANARTVWESHTDLAGVARRPPHGAPPFDRLAFDQSMRKNLFYINSFDIYSGIGSTETRGFFDYGPPGCALQTNFIEAWRKHFVLEEDMLEVDCTSLTPYEVLKTSGHVDRFTDWICKDVTTGETFRADHLVKETLESRLHDSDPTRSQRGGREAGSAIAEEYRDVLAKIDTCTGSDLAVIIDKHKIRSPKTGNSIGAPVPFNLMFETKVGPNASSGPTSASFLRPETAQGQFLNFQKLFNYNQRSMPFASASIGKCYRNEISPRSGLLRVREFLLAEIEHFVDPLGGKHHARFAEVADVKLCFLDKNSQGPAAIGENYTTIAEAVAAGFVDNETLGYFLARVQIFLVDCGVDPSKLRFRQHTTNEMAHYATDCWDAEILTSYGWIECVGCADRSAYDLTVHSERSRTQLAVRESLDTPVEVEEFDLDINRRSIGIHFRRDAKAVEEALLNLDQEHLKKLAVELSSQGTVSIHFSDRQEGEERTGIVLGKDMISINKRKRIVKDRQYTPNVIEPSFGVGRILYAILEHSWWVRPDGRPVLSLPHALAPLKVQVVPLSRHSTLIPVARRLASRLKAMGISARLDESSTSVGKKYHRMDSVGTPMGLTVDFQSLRDESYTLRDRDTTEQVRGSEDEVLEAIGNLVRGVESWADVTSRLPKFEAQE